MYEYPTSILIFVLFVCLFVCLFVPLTLSKYAHFQFVSMTPIYFCQHDPYVRENFEHKGKTNNSGAEFVYQSGSLQLWLPAICKNKWLHFFLNGLSIIEMYNSPKGGSAHCLGCTIQKSYQCLYSILWLVKICPVFSLWAKIPSFFKWCNKKCTHSLLT